MTPQQIYDRHAGLAPAFVRRGAWYPPPGSDWGDLHQAARLALWEAAQAWRPERGAFSTFANRVMSRHMAHWLDRRTRQERRYARAVQASEEWLCCLEPWKEPDLDGQLRLRLAWRRLHPRHRAVLLLCVGYGWTTGEVARECGITPKQADNLLGAAKRRAREVAELGPEPPQQAPAPKVAPYRPRRDRLTAAQVAEIRARCERDPGRRGLHAEIAREYGVCRSHVCRIASGQRRQGGR